MTKEGGVYILENSFRTRLSHAWNVFTDNDKKYVYSDRGYSSSTRPDRIRFHVGNERSIIASIYNRFSVDAAAITIEHIKSDSNDRYKETMNSGLNNCLTMEANIDQTGRALIQDIVVSMFDEGCVAIVPTEITINPSVSSSYDISTLRTGKILEWYPQHVRVLVYNEKTGRKEELVLAKNMVGIVENPFYSIMNEPNSTLKRLILKLNIMDTIDQQSGSGKLDLIIQLPYIIRSAARKDQAEQRRKDIEMQLASSKFGVAYTDGTEKVTQLNRPIENNLMSQVTYLTSMLYSQLGINESVLDGTADEQTMINYYNSIIEPVVSSIINEMKRKFLTKTARTQKQSIAAFRDPFRLVPVAQLAIVADSLSRNEILSANEVRSVIGYKPSSDTKADELRNKNIGADSNPDQLMNPSNLLLSGAKAASSKKNLKEEKK